MSALRSLNIVFMRNISNTPQPFYFEADIDQKQDLAKRFDLESVHFLSAEVELWRQRGGVELKGRFVADAVQRCVVSREPVPAHVEGQMRLRFETFGRSTPQELELEADMLDVLPLGDDAVELAEAVAQSFCLALDPYPRASDAVIARYRQYLLSEGEAASRAQEAQQQRNPFASLRLIQGKQDPAR